MNLTRAKEKAASTSSLICDIGVIMNLSINVMNEVAYYPITNKYTT